MKLILTAGAMALALSACAGAQEGERLCCHLPEGVWLDGTYTPAACTAMGEDYAPQGDGRAAMCTAPETIDIPGNPPGAPGSPGGGPGDGPGGGGGGGDGSGDGGDGGAGVQVPDDDLTPCQRSDAGTYCLADWRIDYREAGEADIADLQTLVAEVERQADFCPFLEAPDITLECQAQGGEYCLVRLCYVNARSNANLVAQNAGRMRNDGELSEAERDDAQATFETASALRSQIVDLLRLPATREE